MNCHDKEHGNFAYFLSSAWEHAFLEEQFIIKHVEDTHDTPLYQHIQDAHDTLRCQYIYSKVLFPPENMHSFRTFWIAVLLYSLVVTLLAFFSVSKPICYLTFFGAVLISLAFATILQSAAFFPPMVMSADPRLRQEQLILL